MNFTYTLRTNLFAIILCVLLFGNSSAQTNVVLRGFITDSLSGEALAFCNINIKEMRTGTSTNEEGYYFINWLPANKSYTVTASYLGYHSKDTVITLTRGVNELDFQLVSTDIKLSEIEKVGEYQFSFNETNIGALRLNIKDLERLPVSVESDILRSLQFVAGVQSVGDASGRYYVRGGTGDQNVVLINGIPLYNPFHALGSFSSVDPDLINSITFYKGSFPAEYGERVSSVLDITSKRGNNQNYAAAAQASFLSGKLIVEGPTPIGSFIVTGRKSFSNEVTKKFFNNNTVPVDFYDFSVRVNYDGRYFNKNGNYSIFVMRTEDKVDYNDIRQADFSWDNTLVGFEWTQIYDTPLFSKVKIYTSNFLGEISPNFSSLKPRSNELRDFTVAVDITYLFEEKDEIHAGIFLKSLKTKLSLEGDVSSPLEFDESSGNLLGYFKYKFLRINNFGADLGLRISFFGLNGNGHFFAQPRLNLTYNPFENVALKGGFGIYQQEISSLSDEDELVLIFDPWIILPDYLEPTRSTHYSVGSEIKLNPTTTLSLEGYYKTISNLPAVNTEKKDLYDNDIISGSGESYGLETAFQFRQWDLNFNLAYTLSWSFKEVNGVRYHPKYDSRHILNLSLDYDFGYDLSAGIIWKYNSGQPFTPIIGFYDKLYITDFSNPWSEAYSYLPYTFLGKRSSFTLPDYHRLDFNVSKGFEIAGIKLRTELNIINVYDRNNLFYFERDTGKRVNMLPFFITSTVRVSI